MTEDQFWQIIQEAHSDESALETALAAFPPQEIISFEKIFAKKHFLAYILNLWGAAYIINGGCSDDGFTDFRYWLISQGKAIYQAAIADPDSLASVSLDKDASHELFGYAARAAYESST